MVKGASKALSPFRRFHRDIFTKNGTTPSLAKNTETILSLSPYLILLIIIPFCSIVFLLYLCTRFHSLKISSLLLQKYEKKMNIYYQFKKITFLNIYILVQREKVL